MLERQDAQQRVGTVIASKYTLLRVLGMGGMGAVYEAEHVFTKRRVALKCMHAQKAGSKIAGERFVREAQAPSAIGHPGIVSVLDGGIDEQGAPYLVLELLEGMPLDEAIAQDRLDPQTLVEVAIELLDALAAAHDKGFVHRDIKPENVFLAHDGRGSTVVKLLDFGIAKVTQGEGETRLTRTGAVLGTPLYMSPEQARGQPVDARTDLWSVGALLYHALAGTPPYDGDSYNALIVSIVTAEHVPLEVRRPDLPKSLSLAVGRALRKDLGHRYQSAAQMIEALSSIEWGAARPASLPPYESLRPPAKGAAAGDAAASSALVAHYSRASSLEGTQEPAAGSKGLWLVVVVAVLALGSVAGAIVLRSSRQQASAHAAASIEELEEAPTPAPSRGAALAPSQDEPTARERKSEDDELRDESTALRPLSPADPEPAAQDGDSAEPPRAPAAPKPLDPDTLSAVLAAHQDELQRCLEESLMAELVAGRAADSPIRLSLSLRIAGSGKVEQVEVLGEAPAELVRCVRQRAQGFVFPSAGGPTDFRFPLLFQPKIVGR